MKQSDLAHLRRLLGWVRCEIGPTPAEQVAGLQKIVRDLGFTSEDVSDESMRRFVEGYDRARAVPKYVRAAVKALERTAGTVGPVVDLQARERRRIGRGGPPP